MHSAVYLSNKKMEIVTGSMSSGRCTVRDFKMVDLPAGLVVNGAVADTAAFDQYIAGLCRARVLPKRNVCLVVGGSQLTTRTLDMPIMGTGRTIAYLSREFPGAGVQDPVYGCFALEESRGTKTVRCWATMAERSFLCAFLQAFERAGCSVISAEAASGAAVRLLSALPCIKERSCLVQHLDEGYLSSYLFVRGKYTYSSRSRLLNASGTMEFGLEVARSVSNIMRFAEAQDAEHRLSDVFFAGMDDDDCALCQDSVYQMSSELNAQRLRTEDFVDFACADMYGAEEKKRIFGQLFHAIAGLDCRGGKTSLYYQYRHDSMRETAVKSRVPAAAPAVLATAVLIGATGRTLYNNRRLSDEAGRLEKRLSTFVVTELADVYERYRTDIDTVDGYVRALETARETLNSYPKINSSVIDRLYDAAEGYAQISVSSYNSASGEIDFTAVASDVGLINEYIGVLRNEEMFAEVCYTGYFYNSALEVWNINAACRLSPDAGRRMEGGA